MSKYNPEDFFGWTEDENEIRLKRERELRSSQHYSEAIGILSKPVEMDLVFFEGKQVARGFSVITTSLTYFPEIMHNNEMLLRPEIECSDDLQKIEAYNLAIRDFSPEVDFSFTSYSL
ncbi:MAG: hypothetical protein KC506_00715 [Nanoarchaeota archaeon]|nr:hypothetical protein [Nanoarchaeota archaeon]